MNDPRHVSLGKLDGADLCELNGHVKAITYCGGD